MNVTTRQRIERRIARRIVTDAILHGYAVSVHDGEEVALDYTTDVQAVMAALMTTDEDTLFFHRGGDRGWVRLVYGNDGTDVIQDYSCKIAHVVAGAEQLASRLEGRSG